MKNYALALALSLLVMLLVLSIGAHAANSSFSTSVTGSSIGAQEGGNSSTIALNYVGNKFVGSLDVLGMMAGTWRRKR